MKVPLLFLKTILQIMAITDLSVQGYFLEIERKRIDHNETFILIMLTEQQISLSPCVSADFDKLLYLYHLLLYFRGVRIIYDSLKICNGSLNLYSNINIIILRNF